MDILSDCMTCLKVNNTFLFSWLTVSPPPRSAITSVMLTHIKRWSTGPVNTSSAPSYNSRALLYCRSPAGKSLVDQRCSGFQEVKTLYDDMIFIQQTCILYYLQNMINVIKLIIQVAIYMTAEVLHSARRCLPVTPHDNTDLIVNPDQLGSSWGRRHSTV